ncbi:32499_t:CDS:2 [Gigaspora margarita]|uniref:32499_t:CDS:1 n=1 Tax=Gigaspora margarita TaxID=4874 RepID=A0ABN7VJ02_GIGMA|nr:32499_t:CDS:2 [Gigaspora margarita]
MCYDHEGKPVFFLFSQDITTNLLEDAWMSLPFEEVNGKIWEDQITDIRNKMHQSWLDQVSLLQYYYLLEEWLKAQFWSLATKKVI